MNSKRRDALRDITRLLQISEGVVSRVLSEEEDCMNNVPENLQGTDRYSEMEDAVDYLSDALACISDATASLTAII